MRTVMMSTKVTRALCGVGFYLNLALLLLMLFIGPPVMALWPATMAGLLWLAHRLFARIEDEAEEMADKLEKDRYQKLVDKDTDGTG